MARMIIMREDGLNGQPNTPSGYRYVGYSGATFSEKSGASVSSIGSGGGFSPGGDNIGNAQLTIPDFTARVLTIGVTLNNSSFTIQEINGN